MSVFFPIFGPLVAIFVLKGRPYARFHAVRALFGDLRVLGFTALVMGISLSITIANAIRFIQSGGEIDWVSVIVRSVAVWLILFLAGAVNTVKSIWHAVRAWQSDDWGGRGWSDKKARAMLSLPTPPPQV